jgi:transcriptional regulator with XRE-family HTH domain
MSTPTIMESDLPRYLRSLRESRAITLREVEGKTGISNSYLSQIESGRIVRPSPQVLHKLSIAYDTSYEDLLALAGYPTPHQHSRRSTTATHNSDRFGQLNPEEEKALLEYLAFLRSRSSKGRRRT